MVICPLGWHRRLTDVTSKQPLFRLRRIFGDFRLLGLVMEIQPEVQMNGGTRVILVSGAPASGKTTVAQPLAKALGFALLTKDEIKEALFDSLGGPVADVEYSRRLGNAAMRILWRLAPSCPRVILEANFRTKSTQERDQVRALRAVIVEVYCRVPPEEASRRFAERAQRERHHPAHALQEITLDQLAEYDQPFNLSPVIEVDTRHPVDIPALAAQLRRQLRE